MIPELLICFFRMKLDFRIANICSCRVPPKRRAIVGNLAYSLEVKPTRKPPVISRKRENSRILFCTAREVENRLVQVINNLDKNTLRSITLFNWIKSAI
jgi:hypothetical protein